MLLLYGALAGLFLGGVIARQRLGCVALLIVPFTMIVYISRWQAAHPENIRSTSGLDFVFGPLWPSLGALAGYYAARVLRAWFARRNGNNG